MYLYSAWFLDTININIILTEISSVDKLDHALLLEDMCGRNCVTDCELYNPVIVSKGTLLKTISFEDFDVTIRQLDFQCNYKVMDDENIKLQCNPVAVYQLTNWQMQLLEAVEHLQDRIEVVHKLEWAEGLRPGISVYVTIPIYPYPVKGIIHHCGRVPDKHGIYFRVELIVS